MKKIVILIGIMFLCCFVSANIYNDCSIYGNCEPIKTSLESGGNYSINVNNSEYWNGNEWSNTRWLNIDGSNANQNIDIGNYLFEAFQFGVENAIYDSAGFEIIDLAMGIRTLNADNGFAMLDFTTMGLLNAMGNNFKTTGSINATTYYGDGSHLTGIETGIWENISGTATYTGDINVTENAQFKNITTDNSIKNSGSDNRVYFNEEGIFTVEG